MIKTNGEKFNKHTKPKLSEKDLEEYISIVNKLAKQLNQGEVNEAELNASREKLTALLEYLVLNLDGPNIDPQLLIFLQKLLGIELDKDLDKDQEKENKLSEEQKKLLHRLIVYEVYKILNPNRLAGETTLENFINNVQARGVKVALEYEGKEFEKMFDKKDLENLESHKFSFVNTLKNEGFRGGGRGL